MNFNNLYATQPFYTATSALSGNPFCNPRTRGVSSTLESLGVSDKTRALSAATCSMGSNLKTCGLGANIGYANRIEGVGDFWGDFYDRVVDPLIGKVGDTLGAAMEAFLGKAKYETFKAAGYKFQGPVDIVYGGQRVSGVKATKPDGTVVVILQNGTEVPFTSDVAKEARTYNPSTGKFNPTTTALIVGGVALVAVLFFVMSKRR
ncbi:MAG: hypothetical protein EBU84_00720 [Actinobacteria bacterium]|nr:hypothetical protein [Actinomycetota bacterium]